MSGERETSVATNVAGPSSRMIIQQCLSAKLEVRPAAADTEAEFVQVGLLIVGSAWKWAGKTLPSPPLHLFSSVPSTLLSFSTQPFQVQCIFVNFPVVNVSGDNRFGSLLYNANDKAEANLDA